MNISNTEASQQQLVLDSQLFYKWKRNLESNRVIIERLEILSVVSRDHKSFYAAMIDCDLLTPEGYRIPRCIILRGDSVVVIPVLHCFEDGEIYTLMVISCVSKEISLFAVCQKWHDSLLNLLNLHFEGDILR